MSNLRDISRHLFRCVSSRVLASVAFAAIVTAALCTSLCALPSAAAAQVVCNYAGQTTPAGLSEFFALSADGVFDPMSADYQLPPGSNFDSNAAGRNAAQAGVRRTEAYNFFLNKYGIDFFTGTTNPDGTVTSADGNVLLFHTAVDPRFKQRVIHSGGDMVPQEGWVVHEGRYAASVIVSNHSLAGSWGGSGEPVPYGATMTDGEWIFEKIVPCKNSNDDSPAGTQSSTIHLRYQTDAPFVPDFLGRAALEYDITPVSGVSGTSGRAVGRFELNLLTGDLIQSVVKATVRLW